MGLVASAIAIDHHRQRAGHAGVGGAQGEGAHLGARQVHADGGGGDLLVAHGHHRPAHPPPDQVPGQHEQHDGDDQAHEVRPLVVVEPVDERGELRPPRAQQGNAARALDVLRRQAREQHGQRQGHQGQLQPPDPQCREAHQHADQPGQHGGDGDGGLERPAVVDHQDRRREGADPEEGPVTNGHLAGEPCEEVEPHRCDREVQRLRDDPVVLGREVEGRVQGHHRQGHADDDAGDEDRPGQGRPERRLLAGSGGGRGRRLGQRADRRLDRGAGGVGRHAHGSPRLTLVPPCGGRTGRWAGRSARRG